MKSFKIEVPQETLDDLNVRLRNTRWTDEGDDSGWGLGTSASYLKEFRHHWLNHYDWRKEENKLNQFPHFKTMIDETTLHFLHIKGNGAVNKPLLLVHGWPDSFTRFLKVIPILTTPDENGFAFDLIIPSIPGFGFSEQKPMNSDQTAILFNKLMTEKLGYQQYFAAGGDMGSTISKSLAIQFPDIISAIHLTDVGYPNGSENWAEMSQPEQEFGQYIQQWFIKEGAFNMLQSTKPQALGYALNDSPIGLASWVVEKFHAWSGSPENLDSFFSKDELITNIMIYWVTQTINSSIRIYAEQTKATWQGGLKSDQRVEVPTGVSLFASEAPFPKEWVNRKVNAKSFNVLDSGSHFAAMSSPELFSKELFDFFS